MLLRKTMPLCFIIITVACVVIPATILSIPFQSSAKQENDFALKDGDRVVFYGDSITEQRLYTTYVEHFALTRYPERKITFINTGWGGDQVTRNECQPCNGVGGLARLDRDVIAYRPTVVTLLFGMNDGRYYDFDAATMKTYEDGLSAIIREIKAKTRARIFVMTPTVYDGTRRPAWSHTDRYNEVLDRYSEAARQIAAREGLPVIDLHTVTTEALKKAKQIKGDYTFVPDGVHLAEDGQLIMAAEILRAWGAAAERIGIMEKEGNFQSDITRSFSSKLEIKAPLPWPSPLPSEIVRKARPEITDLGLVKLRIAIPTSGKYSVTVDGSPASEFSADQLKAGIALTSEKAMAESRSLAALIRRRADLFFTRWRQIEVPLAKDYKSAARAISSIDSLIEEMTARARALSKPHTYEIVIKPIQ